MVLLSRKLILLNYPKVENFLPLSSALGMSYTFFNKETGEIEDFNRYDEGNEEMIKKLAGSFDDFIDSLYVDEEYVADLRANVEEYKEGDRWGWGSVEEVQGNNGIA